MGIMKLLLTTAAAVKLDPFLGKIEGNLTPTHPLEFHPNEDQSSVPDPMTHKKYMTSTQAKLLSKVQDDLAHEPLTPNPDWYTPYNYGVPEPSSFVQLPSIIKSYGMTPVPEDAQLWMVNADYGEWDDQVVVREANINNDNGGTKFSGWVNPLSRTDDGNDDDVVLV